METRALDAYASGLREGWDRDGHARASIGLPMMSSKLLWARSSHISHNSDTLLMVIAAIFAGIFAFSGDLAIRGLGFPLWLATHVQA